jgi:hypothetical protein
MVMVRGSDDDRVHSGVSEQVMVIGVPFSVGGTLQAGSVQVSKAPAPSDALYEKDMEGLQKAPQFLKMPA